MVDLATITAFDRFVRHLLAEPRARATVLAALTQTGSREARAEGVRSAIRVDRPSPIARPAGLAGPIMTASLPRLTASQAYEFVVIFDQIRARDPRAVDIILAPDFPNGGEIPRPFGPFFS